MDITINIVELASELADREMRNSWKILRRTLDFDSVALVEDSEGCYHYTEDFQKEFNMLYDIFFDMILNCRV